MCWCGKKRATFVRLRGRLFGECVRGRDPCGTVPRLVLADSPLQLGDDGGRLRPARALAAVSFVREPARDLRRRESGDGRQAALLAVGWVRVGGVRRVPVGEDAHGQRAEETARLAARSGGCVRRRGRPRALLVQPSPHLRGAQPRAGGEGRHRPLVGARVGAVTGEPIGEQGGRRKPAARRGALACGLARGRRRRFAIERGRRGAGRVADAVERGFARCRIAAVRRRIAAARRRIAGDRRRIVRDRRRQQPLLPRRPEAAGLVRRRLRLHRQVDGRVGRTAATRRRTRQVKWLLLVAGGRVVRERAVQVRARAAVTGGAAQWRAKRVTVRGGGNRGGRQRVRHVRFAVVTQRRID